MSFFTGMEDELRRYHPTLVLPVLALLSLVISIILYWSYNGMWSTLSLWPVWLMGCFIVGLLRMFYEGQQMKMMIKSRSEHKFKSSNAVVKYYEQDS